MIAQACIFCDGRPHDPRASHFARSRSPSWRAEMVAEYERCRSELERLNPLKDRERYDELFAIHAEQAGALRRAGYIVEDGRLTPPQGGAYPPGHPLTK